MGVVEQELRDVAVRLAREAADLVNAVRDAAIGEVDTKTSETDVVTAGDRAAERHVRARLAQLRPGEPMIGEEEGGGSGGASGVCWVVDPIDGTVNYLYGFPWYSVSVAAQVAGVSVAGAVVEPASGRCWTAVRGEGAYLEAPGQPRVRLRASRTQRLELALVATGFAYRPQRRARQAAAMARLLGSVRDLRRAGSAALDLCSVAAGWVDGYIEHGLNRWDWAAGALIAEEAGAVVRVPSDTPEGNADGFGADGFGADGLGADAVFAAAPGVADQLRRALVGSGVGQV